MFASPKAKDQHLVTNAHEDFTRTSLVKNVITDEPALLLQIKNVPIVRRAYTN